METVLAPIPLHGFIGGLMIGIAAVVMLLGNGRIAGVSGMAARGLWLTGGTPWMLAVMFLVGLPLGAFVIERVSGGVITRFPSSPAILILGGLVVGFSTRLGSGCTSGHGVCGLSRLSRRSIVATASFMVTGIITVALMRLTGITW